MVPFACDMSFLFYRSWIDLAVVSYNRLLNHDCWGHIVIIRIIMRLYRYLCIVKTDTK